MKRGRKVKKVALSGVKDDLAKFPRLAEREAIFIPRHGKPAGVPVGVPVGFADEGDWFDY